MRWMQYLFSICGLCGAQFFKMNGYSYGCSGKVDTVKNGQHLIGYILEEIGDRWKVCLENNADVLISRVYYRKTLKWIFLSFGKNSCRMIVRQYCPVRFMVGITGDCRIRPVYSDQKTSNNGIKK